MRKFLAGIVFAIVAGGLGAYFYTRDGHMPINADVSPGRVETYFATRAFDATVDRQAPKINNPVQVNDENLKSGLAIYSMNCAVCHGMPGKVMKTIGTGSYPPDYQNFWIIKHGVRYTAMPSWGKMLNDEEIWKVSTFLTRWKDLPSSVKASVQ